MYPYFLNDISKWLLIIFLIAGCDRTKKHTAGDIHQQRFLQADLEPENWMSLGRNFQQQHHTKHLLAGAR
jgi:hypothetical protein